MVLILPPIPTTPPAPRRRQMRRLSLALLAAPVFAVSAQSAPGSILLNVGKTSVPQSQPLHILVVTTHTDAASSVVRTDSTDDRRPMTMANVAPGQYRLEARVIGFIPETTFVTVTAGAATRVDLELRRATIVLEKVDIAGNGKGHLADFERRRLSGKGSFITGVDIAKKGQHNISETLRGVRGLRVDCKTTCHAQMVRSTNCEPRYFINGFPTDSQILFTPVLDVAGIEIYRGPSETPGEFLGADSMCGAIVIWTK